MLIEDIRKRAGTVDQRDNDIVVLLAEYDEIVKLIRDAEQKQSDMPFLLDFQKKYREKPIREIIKKLDYRNDQYWTIVGILANYPHLQKDDEDLSGTVRRVVDLLCTVQAMEAKQAICTTTGSMSELVEAVGAIYEESNKPYSENMELLCGKVLEIYAKMVPNMDMT